MKQANAEVATHKPFVAPVSVSNAPSTQVTKLAGGTRIATEVIEYINICNFITDFICFKLVIINISLYIDWSW